VRLVAVTLYGTDEVVSAAQDLYEAIADNAHRDSSDLYLSAYLKVLRTMRRDTAGKH
jgi:hypothetical protein